MGRYINYTKDEVKKHIQHNIEMTDKHTKKYSEEDDFNKKNFYTKDGKRIYCLFVGSSSDIDVDKLSKEDYEFYKARVDLLKPSLGREVLSELKYTIVKEWSASGQKGICFTK